jgi:hypothetical protein
MVDHDVLTSVARHAHIHGFTRGLDHGEATALLNGLEPCGAVIEITRQDHSHHTRAVGQGAERKSKSIEGW